MNPTKRILVVDDDTTILHLMEMLLAAEGFEVATASSGDDALELLQTETFDLHLIDLIMPAMDGIETILSLRSLRKDAKIIAMSGGWNGGTHNCLTLAEKLGAFCTLAKPFDRDTLLKVIQSVLQDRPEQLPVDSGAPRGFSLDSRRRAPTIPAPCTTAVSMISPANSSATPPR